MISAKHLKSILASTCAAALFISAIPTTATRAEGESEVNVGDETTTMSAAATAATGYQNFKVDLFDYNTSAINGINNTIAGANAPGLNFWRGPSSGAWYNNYSGNRASNAGSCASQGIVAATRVNGEPSFNVGTVPSIFTVGDDSYNGITYKQSYGEVSFPFKYDGTSGTYSFDSDNQYASFDGTKVNVAEGNSNAVKFTPFNNTAYRAVLRERLNQNENEYNNYDPQFSFGMKLGTSFSLPQYGTVDGTANGAPLVFNFSGDDDVWVFIDDQLVLDLGGIHGKTNGNINFKTGQSYVQGTIDPSNICKNDVSIDFYKEGFNLATLAGKEHTLTVYYFERGAGDSNCKISFNLPVINTEDTPTDVFFKKVDAADTSKGLSGAKFTLKSTDGTVTVLGTNGNAEQVSDASGMVRFVDVVQGTYTLTETTVPDGYDPPTTNTWNVIVSSNGSGGSNYIITQAELLSGNYILKNNKHVVPVEDPKAYKKAEVINYDDRTYKLTLDATAPVDTSTTVTKTSADVALIIDNSGSMIYTDAKIINGANSQEAFGMLSNLDTGKIYFTGSNTGYEATEITDTNVKNRLMPTASSGNNYYNIPKSGNYLFYSDVDNAWFMRPISDLNKYYALDANGKQEKIQDADTYELDANGEYWRHVKTGNILGHEYEVWFSTDKTPKEYTLYHDVVTGPYIKVEHYHYNTIYLAATKIDINTCPSIIYTNRSEVVRNAVKSFVGGLTDDSRVCITTFNSISGTTSTGFMVPSLINTDVIAGRYNTATYTAEGLAKAAEELNGLSQSTNKKYAILFTDGETNSQPADVNSSSTSLKNAAPGGVYAIGTGGTTSIITRVATDADHQKSLSDVTGLASVLEEIKTEIITTGSSGTVVDDVDPRFELIDDNGTPLTNGVAYLGGTVSVNNGNYSIRWENQLIGDGSVEFPKWEQVIKVRAKADFRGGNKIPTNGPGSGVTVGDKTIKFPQPTVNVKSLNVTMNSGSITLFKGETIDTSAYINELTGVGANCPITVPYIDATGDNVGRDIYTLTLDGTTTNVAHKATKASTRSGGILNPVETYTVTKTYAPYSVTERNDQPGSKVVGLADPGTNCGDVATNREASGTYKVYVIAGQIKIIKHIPAGLTDIEVKQGDPIFSFKVKNVTTGKTVYRTARFVVINDTEWIATIDDLDQGIYEITELKTMRFKLGGKTIDLDNTNCQSAELTAGNGYEAAVGYTGLDKSKAEVSGIKYYQHDKVAVIFNNTKTNDKNFSDTDVVKNTYMVGTDGKIQSTVLVQSRIGGEKPKKTTFNVPGQSNPVTVTGAN